MDHYFKQKTHRIYYTFMLMMALSWGSLYGQYSISGPIGATLGDTKTYTLMGSNIFQTSWHVGSQGAIQGTTNPGTTTIQVKWNSTGSSYVSVDVVDYYYNSYFVYHDVSVTEPAPSVPGNPTISTNGCGQATLARSGSPPSGTTWYWQGKNSSGTSTSKGSGSTFTANEGTGTYYIRARNSSGVWSSSSGSRYVSMVNLTAGSINGAQTICYSGNPSTLGSSSGAGGISGSYSYQWQYSANGSSGWSNIGGATASTYDPPAGLTVSRWYRRRVSCAAQTMYTNTVKVTVYPNLSAGSVGGAQTICYSGDPGTLSNSSSASGGDGSYGYQWQYSSDGSSGWTNISGATSSTYNPPGGLTASRWYRRRAISCGQTKYTGSVKVTVRPSLSAGSIGGAHTICEGENPNMLTSGSLASGGDGSYSYQWQYSNNGSSGWTNISGATSTTYDPPSGLMVDRWYQRRAISCGETKYTGSVKVTVTQGPLFYADTDGDGYGDPGNTTNACSQPSGYVSNNSDYDDTTVMITNIAPQTYYKDADGDGFGVSTPTVYASFRPLGYANNASDQCPDTPGTGNGCNDYLPPTLSDENYIYSRNYQVSMSSAGNIGENGDILESITYYDGLGRPKQNIGIRASGTSTTSSPNTPAEWIMDWTEGNGGTPFFNQNGVTSENERFYGPNPFGETDLIWRCGNEPDNGSDGGWTTDYFNVDKTKTYRYMVWVRRDGSQNGSTYHGTQNVEVITNGNRDNPYFWSGDLPQLGQWYLLVGIVHPYTHGSTDTGVSGVYDMNGTRVIDATEYKWRSDTTTARFRSYFYYSTDVNTRQYFYRPILEVVDGNEIPLQDMFSEGKAEDIVTHIGYDSYGRQDREWLPYHEPSGNMGSYRGNVSTATQQYYQNSFSQDFIGLSTANVNAYSEKDLEDSPLNRILEQAAPGKDWKLGGGHGIQFGYLTNLLDEVRKYRVTLSFANGTYTPTLVSEGYYVAGELYKTVTKDENHDGTSTKLHTTEEFTDKQGRVVLKRTYATVNASVTPHDTYYVYDGYGNLSYVLPPKVVHDSSISATELSELCYQYVYDHRNRLVEKKIPGKGWEEIVYDQLDRPIMTRDANLEGDDQWLFSKYDAFGRVIYTGRDDNTTSTRVALQNAADAETDTYEAKRGTALNLAGTNVYYSNDAYPTSYNQVYTINYYDSYVDTDGLSVPATVLGQNTVTGSSLKGLATVGKVRVLGTNDWITTITGYDSKRRAIYLATNNDYLGTTDIVETKLDFAGKVLETKTTHTKGANPAIVTTDLYDYDHMGRLVKQRQVLGGNTETVANNHYDALGQLIVKETANSAQTVDYAYNVRGWLKQINDPYNLGTDLFGFRISYNEPEARDSGNNPYGIPLYNGNISETIWHTANDVSSVDVRGYFYEYDALNRLRKGDYIWKYSYQNYHRTENSVGAVGFHEELTYDRNGNIGSLKRGGSSEAYAYIDDLVYAYDNGNKLLGVTDSGTDADPLASDFKDGNPGVDYTYDANGNMTQDLNKEITGITYNHLNLPTTIVTDSGNISYVYDATGTKLQKTVSVGSSVTDYAGNYIYENGTLQFFAHAEGYVTPDGMGGYDYIYQYKDHLGNIRLSYVDDGNGGLEIVEENNYYPFGLKHKGYNGDVSPNGNSVAQKWKYNGVELDETTGLYEMDFRQYDAAIGRFTAIDPVTHHSMSTYTGFDNNPIFWTDPSGANGEKNYGPGTDAERAKENKPEWDNTISSNAGGGNGGCCPTGYSGSGVVTGDGEQYVNTLEGVTITPKGATRTRSGGWSTESERYGYSASPSQYREEHGNQSREGWEIEHGSQYNQLVAQWTWEEQNRRTLAKLGIFLAYTSTVGEAFLYANPSSYFTKLTPFKTFSYTPRYPMQPLQIHGNSLLSPKPTWSYKLYSNDGTFLKNGITSELIPQSRYSKSFMADKFMDDLILHPNRRAAYDFEYLQNTILRGPLNKNMH